MLVDPLDGRLQGHEGGRIANESQLVGQAREVLRATCGYASRWKTVGELFIFARAWANNRRLQLAARHSIGHDVLPPRGPLRLGYPHSAHTLTRLRRHQVHVLNPRRLHGAVAIRPPVTDGERVAAFEEIVWVDGDRKRVLGREHLDEIGTLPSLSAPRPADRAPTRG